MVLIWAAASTLIIAGVIMSATQRLKAVDEVSRAEFSAGGQAASVAEAGIVDGFAWFRRQQVQPVATFAPVRNLTASPPVNETDDAAVGLVRTYEISPGLWARYTLRKTVAAEAYTDRNANGHYDAGETFTDTDHDGRWSPSRETRDVTLERGLTGAGTVWQLVSHAQVFRRPDADQAIGAGPNVQIAEATLAAELRRLTLAPPATAAICVSKSASISVGTRGRVRSDTTCVAYGTNNGTVQISAGELVGPTKTALVPGWKDTVESVFGVDWPSLQSMADISTTDPVGGLPATLPHMSLVVVTGNLTYTQKRPLRGTAVLIVKGNVDIQASSNSFFNGLLYVDGNLTVRAPAMLRGTFICRGALDVKGTSGDFVDVERDPKILTKLMTVMGQYRMSKAPFKPSRLMVDGRPDEAWTLGRPTQP